MERRLGLQ
jgi:hypothetical protein